MSYVYITPKIGQNISKYLSWPNNLQNSKENLKLFYIKKSITITYVKIVVIINQLYKNKFLHRKMLVCLLGQVLHRIPNHRERKSTYSVFLQKGVCNFVLKS